MNVIQQDCVACVNEKQYLDVSKIPELSSIEYVLFLLKECNLPESSLEEEMSSRLVPMPETIDVLDIKSMSKREFLSAYRNVRTARERLVACLQSGGLISLARENGVLRRAILWAILSTLQI
jgi:hypothetical protein